jgi:preprotein translocase subunit SecE
MGQTESKDSTQKVSWFTGLKAEFNKIIWPNQKSLVRQTTAVVAVSVALGLVIALIDWIVQNGVNFLVGLSF